MLSIKYIRENLESVQQSLLKKYSKRDQISFMYVLWKYKINILIIPDNSKNFYINIKEHKKNRKKYKCKSIIYDGKWLKCFHPYENKYYYYNTKNKMCKWSLDYEKELIYDEI